MCFSASASFAASALLLPTGLGCYAIARTLDPKWLPLSIFPIAFAIQQATEGMLWLGLTSGDDQLINLSARAFLFFSHFFWLTWVPYSIYKIEENQTRKIILFWMVAAGLLAGASVLLPIFYMKDWVIVKEMHHSLQYNTILLSDSYISRTILRGLYGAFIVLGLCLSSDFRIQFFGILIALSLLITTQFYSYALISVWCFFAAILSCYVLLVLIAERRKQNQLLKAGRAI